MSQANGESNGDGGHGHHEEITHDHDSVHTRLRANTSIMNMKKILGTPLGPCMVSLLSC